MNSITQYINSKFEPYADCQEVQEIREEILLNCMDRYNDSIASGMSEKQAHDSVVESLGDLDGLLASIAQDHPSDFTLEKREEQPSADETGVIHTIEVSVLSSDVRLTSSNTDEIVVETSGSIIQHQDGGILTIQEEKSAGSLFFSSSGKVEIGVPAGFGTIHVRTKSGDISVSQIDAATFTLTATSGDIDGDLRVHDAIIHSLSGDIDMKIVGVNGDVKVNSTSGDVDLQLYGCRTLDVSSTSGDIDVCLHDGFEACRLNAISGDISVDAGRLEGVEVHMRSVSGDCHCNVPSVNGYNVIEARTVSGNVSIDR